MDNGAQDAEVRRDWRNISIRKVLTFVDSHLNKYMTAKLQAHARSEILRRHNLPCAFKTDDGNYRLGIHDAESLRQLICNIRRHAVNECTANDFWQHGSAILKRVFLEEFAYDKPMIDADESEDSEDSDYNDAQDQDGVDSTTVSGPSKSTVSKNSGQLKSIKAAPSKGPLATSTKPTLSNSKKKKSDRPNATVPSSKLNNSTIAQHGPAVEINGKSEKIKTQATTPMKGIKACP